MWIEHLIRIEEALARIERRLERIERKENVTIMTLDQLKAQVDANRDAEASAVALLTGLSAQIEALKGDPAKLQALADELKTSGDALASAILANTPAAPTPA